MASRRGREEIEQRLVIAREKVDAAELCVTQPGRMRIAVKAVSDALAEVAACVELLARVNVEGFGDD